MTGLMNLETDIGLAKQYRLPVLITAPADRALPVAREIAAGGKKNKKRLPVVMFDGAAIVSAALGDGRANGTATDDVVLVVREVHALSDTEQAALMLLLYDGEEGRHRRIIATSSVCLFDRVARGAFNAKLFYRLNAIHIVSHSCSDRASATRPCCSESTDYSSCGSQEAQSRPF
jgi:hypothetical protein